MQLVTACTHRVRRYIMLTEQDSSVTQSVMREKQSSKKSSLALQLIYMLWL